MTIGAGRSLLWHALEGRRVKLAIYLPDHLLFTFWQGVIRQDLCSQVNGSSAFPIGPAQEEAQDRRV